jgi:hypothetical protein
MDKIKNRDKILLEEYVSGLKKMHSSFTKKFLANYLIQKHESDKGFQYVVSHNQ